MGSSAIANAIALVVLAGGCQSGGGGAPDLSCVPRALIDTGSDAPLWFALDAENAYWGASDGVRAAPLCAGETRTLVSGVSAGALAVADETVYFSEGIPGSISAAQVAGGEAIALVAQRGYVNDLAVDEQFVYFLDGDALRRVARGGGDAVDLVTGLIDPTGLVLAGDKLRWVNRGSEQIPGEVVEMAIGSGVVDTIAPGDDYAGGHVGALAVDGQTIYFGGWVGELYAIDGSDTEQLIIRDQSALALAAGGDTLYWVNQPFEPSSPLFGLWSLSQPTTGSSTPVLLDARAVGHTLALSSGTLYYLVPEGIRRH